MGVGERRPMSCQLEQNRRDSAGERVFVDSDDIALYNVRRARCYTFEPAVLGNLELEFAYPGVPWRLLRF